VIRVVVTGSECTGKTTLATALARHYETVASREFVRDFVDRKGAAPVYADVEEIARGQIAVEEAAVREARRLVILDTDLLSTFVYSRHYYGDCPVWIDEAVNTRKGHLYLLAGTDVPWVADDGQRDRTGRRQEMHSLFRSELIARGLSFVELWNSHEDRMRRAIREIDKLIGDGSFGCRTAGDPAHSST